MILRTILLELFLEGFSTIDLIIEKVLMLYISCQIWLNMDRKLEIDIIIIVGNKLITTTDNDSYVFDSTGSSYVHVGRDR